MDKIQHVYNFELINNFNYTEWRSNMRKRNFAILSLLMSVVVLGGCGKKGNLEKSDAKTYPVKTVEVKSSAHPISLEYDGLTGGSEVRKLSFKSPARISKIYVVKGQHVKKGDSLVDLDKSDLNLAMEAAKSQMDAASATYNKAMNGAQEEDRNKAEIAAKNAQDTYNYYKNLYDKNAKLYDNGVIPKQQLDGIKLQMDSSESALNAAKQTMQQAQDSAREEDRQAALGQLNTAKANYDSKVNLVQDASMVADSDGYVVNVLYKEGEMVAAGYPVVVFRSDDQVVTVGFPEDDVKKVQVGTKAQVKIHDTKSDGEIINLVQMPDAQSGTYSAEIKLLTPVDNDKFYIGETVKVNINIGEKNSIWIPISSILNDGEDYVYVVESGHSVKKNISLGETDGDKVAVEGLKAGDKLVIEGMKNIKAGYQVAVK